MSSLKYHRAGFPEARRPAGQAARRLAAVGLRSMSATLARLSRRIARPASPAAHAMPQLEFYAEAGAPEGALYLDGQLVGWLKGVNRL